MHPFRVHQGKVAPLDRTNVDTDQIIPKQFLKRIERTGFGEFLFYDWRRAKDGSQDPSFSLNQPRFAGASVLVAGKNFGCGSSREHAVWALEDFGFRAVIAPSFADIFANNCVKNGVLTVVLTEKEVEEIVRRATERPDYHLAIDLERCEVHDDSGFSASFRSTILPATACSKAWTTSDSPCNTSLKSQPTSPVIRQRKRSCAGAGALARAAGRSPARFWNAKPATPPFNGIPGREDSHSAIGDAGKNNLQFE